MISKEQIRDLLGEGLAVQVVADAVGTSCSYIGQLLSQEDFAQEVAELRAKNLRAASERDRRIDGLEDRLITNLEQNLDMIFKPSEVLRALAMVNRMTRRGVPAEANLQVKQNIVNLTIPTQLVQNFVVNGQGEVVEVEGQTLQSMPAHSLLKNLQQQHEGKDGERYKRTAGFLPGGIETGITPG